MNKILISLNHPAHYHLFKNTVVILKQKGYEVIYVISNKDILERLMISEGVEYVKLNEQIKRKKNIFSVFLSGGFDLVRKDYLLYRFVRKYKPSIMLGTDVSITHIGKLLNIPSMFFNEDDFEINKLACLFSYPFVTKIVSPDICSVGKYEAKKIAYKGYQKIAYLHPNYFTPNYELIKDVVPKDEPYFIIRLVSLTAGHDLSGRHDGISSSLLDDMIDFLSKRGRVFITSETAPDTKYDKYILKIEPNLIHHLISYATLFVADSQSMCFEAGLLGTPYIRHNDFVGKISVLNEVEQHYKLGVGIPTERSSQLISTIEELLATSDLKKRWKEKANQVYKDKIDVAKFYATVIEHEIKRNSK